MAIMTYSGGAVQVLQDFTDDRDELLATHRDPDRRAKARASIETPATIALPTPARAFGQDDGEFNIFNTDRQLAALQTAAKMLGQLQREEVADLLRQRPAAERRRQPGAAAAPPSTRRSAPNVSFYPIDARGLVAQAPLGDATQRLAGRHRHVHRRLGAWPASTSFQRSQDTLYTLAADTGGKALLDTNDLSLGIVQAQQAISQLLHPRLLHHQHRRSTASSAASRSR